MKVNHVNITVRIYSEEGTPFVRNEITVPVPEQSITPTLPTIQIFADMLRATWSMYEAMTKEQPE